MIETMADLAADGKKIDEIAQKIGVSRRQFFRLLHNFPEFQEAYAEAKEILADCEAQDALAEAKTPIPTDINPKIAGAWVQRQKLIVDTLKWTASKLKPKSWGDRVEVDHTGNVTVSPLQQLRQIGAKMNEKPVLEAEIVEDEDCF